MTHRAVRDCSILLIDDEEANLDLLQQALAIAGYRALVRVSDARQVRAIAESCTPDLVLLDLHMPHHDGFAILRELRELIPPDEYLPVLVLTADATSDARERALTEGAHDFLTKPFDVIEVQLRVRNLLRTRMLHVAERAAREAAERAALARDRMLSVVAHDLRNPLASVGVNVETAIRLLRRPPDDSGPALASAERLLAGALRTAAGMQRLVDDLLDVARLEEGRFDLAMADEPLAPLLASLDAMLRPLAELRGIRLTMPDAGDAAVHADGARVEQVLANVIGNAIKFTPDGGEVSVTVERSGSTVCLAVHDDGPGIPAGDLPHLFEAFWRGRGGNRQGAGLGLWIARTLTEAQGGRIAIASAEGEGTTVAVELQGARVPAARVEAAATE